MYLLVYVLHTVAALVLSKIMLVFVVHTGSLAMCEHGRITMMSAIVTS